MRFFRDFIENLPTSSWGSLERALAMLTVEKGAQDARQRSLTRSACGRDTKVVAENLPVAGAKAPFVLSAQLLIHASHESPPPRGICLAQTEARTPRAERI